MPVIGVKMARDARVYLATTNTHLTIGTTKTTSKSSKNRHHFTEPYFLKLPIPTKVFCLFTLLHFIAEWWKHAGPVDSDRQMHTGWMVAKRSHFVIIFQISERNFMSETCVKNFTVNKLTQFRRFMCTVPKFSALGRVECKGKLGSKPPYPGSCLVGIAFDVSKLP